MAGLACGVGAGGGLAENETDPAELLDVGEGAENGGSGDVVAAVSSDECMIVSSGEASEVGVVDGDGNKISVGMTNGHVFEIE